MSQPGADRKGTACGMFVDGGNIHSQSLILKYPYLEWCKSRCTLEVYVVYTEKYHVYRLLLALQWHIITDMPCSYQQLDT